MMRNAARIMDFSQPFFATGLAIAVPTVSRSGILSSITRRIISPPVLVYAGSLVVLLLVIGSVVWLVERRRNPEHFHKGLRGIGDGLWWAAVTMR